MKLRTMTGTVLVLGLLLVALSGCDNNGPAENAGENIDNAIDSAGDSLENAADSIQDAGQDARN